MSRRGGWLWELPALGALAFALWLLGTTFFGRVGFDWDLEWMEGGVLLHALRVLNGEPLYAAPSPDWIPFLYPPLHPWVLAAAAKVFGLGYALGRSLSLLGILAASAALVAAVRLERGSWPFALGGAALFLSCYDDAGSFYDLVRNDGLLIALLSWSWLAVRAGRPVAGGLLLAAAFATKQSAAPFGLVALAWLWRVQGRRAALAFLAASAGTALLFVGLMQWRTGGLFLVYLLEVPAAHPFVRERLFPGAPRELVMALPWTTALVAVAGVCWVVRWRWKPAVVPGGWSGGTTFWAFNAALAVVLSAVTRAHHGGFLNVLIPAFWMGALWAGLAAGALVAHWPSRPLRLGLAALFALQVWTGRWQPASYTPTAADRAAAQQLVDRLARIEGDVLSPHAPYAPVLAGKRGFFPLIALWDINHPGGPLTPSVDRILEAMAAQRWDAVLTADEHLIGLEPHYERGETVTPEGTALLPKAGWQVRPRYLYFPKR